MALKIGNRYQISLIPQSIESYVGDSDPVRVYDVFIDALDLEKLGIEVNPNKVGNSQYHPKTMLKLLVYAYSYGIKSSRMIERACHHNLSFMWLTGGMKPVYKTISDFRKDNIKAIKQVLKECVGFCIKLNLIEGNILFVDGSKIRANAGIANNKDKETLEKRLKYIDEEIEKLLTDIENIDKSEENLNSLVEISKELTESKRLKEKIKKALEEMKKENTTNINTTDKDAIKVKGRQGLHAGMNLQVVTDGKHGLIVSSDVVKDANDTGQLSKQIKQANEILGKTCKISVGDAGYSNAKEFEELEKEEIEVIVPSKKQASKNGKENPFDKKNFEYNKEKDEYKCPEGKVLKRIGKAEKQEGKIVTYIGNGDCLECQYYGKCTTGKKGRTIERRATEETAERVEKNYETERAQKIYARRKEVSELPFGYMKRFLNGGYFLLRGLEKVNAEASLLCTCFNLRRMMTLLGGVCPMIEKLKITG